MSSRLVRLAVVALAVGAAGLMFASKARAAELNCSAGCGLVTPVTLPAAFAETGGDAKFSTTQFGSSGTGVIDSFLRVQNDGVEDGHNTGSSTLLNDEKSGSFTTNLQLNQVQIVTLSGQTYYQFLLDINQTGDSLLALNNVQICTAASANLTATDTCPGTLKYSFGTFGSGTDWILLDAGFSGSGSGKADLFMYVPTSALGPQGSTYVYLFSQFGLANHAGTSKNDVYGDSNDGFEEWAVERCFPNCAATPEPGSWILLGTGILGLAALVRRSRSVIS